MEIQFDHIKDVVPFVGLVAWLVRVEFVSKQNKHDIAIIWTKHDDMLEKLSKIESSLARIEGRLSVNREI